MKRSSITRRLVAYFALVLGLFALAMGALFAVMFRDYTIKLHMDALQAQARQMASSLSGYRTRMGRLRFSPTGGVIQLSAI